MNPSAIAPLLLAACTLPVAARAATPPQFAKLDPKDLCPPGGGPISKDSLARSIYQLFYPSVGKVVLHSIPYDIVVREITHACTTDCTAETKATRTLMVTTTQLLFDPALSGNGATIKLPKLSIQATRLAQLTPAERQAQPLLAASGAAAVLSTKPDLFALACVPPASLAPAPPADGTPIADNPAPSAPSVNPPVVGEQLAGTPPLSPAEYAWDRLRVRVKPTDLTVYRDQTAFAGLSGASLAIVDDDIAKKDTLDLHIVVGFNIGSHQFANGTALDSIPFIGYDRDYISTAKPVAGSDINNISFGVLENLNFPIFGIYNNLTAIPKYIYDDVRGAEVVKLALSFEPQPLQQFFGSPLPVGDTGFEAMGYAKVLLSVGDVIYAANQPTLNRTTDFVQGGGELGFDIFNDSKTTPWGGLALPITYDYLYGFSGQHKDLHLFNAALNYTFPNTKYLTIGLSYTDGANLDTFQLQKIYKVTIGLKL